MSDWVAVDPSEFTTWEKKRLNGVMVNVSVSPYDIPEAVRAFRAPNSNWFHIQLKYSIPEALTLEKISSDMEVVYGINSRRVQEIRIDLTHFPHQEQAALQKLQHAVWTAIDYVANQSRRSVTQSRLGDSFSVTKDILTSRRNLFEEATES